MHKHSIKEDRFYSPMETDKEKIKEETLASLSGNRTGKLAHYTQLLTSLKKAYVDYFGQLHWEVRPLQMIELQELCQKKNVNIKALSFKHSGLFNNACNAPNCPFFLKITDQNELKRHLDSWAGRMPLGFHKFVAKHLEKDNEVIFEKLCKENHFDLDQFKVSKEFTLNYIEKVKNFYLLLPKEELQLILEKLQNDNDKPAIKKIKKENKPKTKEKKGKDRWEKKNLRKKEKSIKK